jgi:hypothetical protein
VKRILWKWPAWFWAAALAPRAILFGLACRRPEACLSPDSQSYLLLAQNLWTHHAFSQAAFPPLIPEISRLPGYPLFLAPFTGLFSSPVLWAAAIQSLLGAATVFILAAWLREMLNERAALAGGLVLAVDLVILLHTPMLLAETLLTFLQVIALDQTWRAWRLTDIRRTAGSGICWGIAVMIKPVFLYLPLLMAGLWWKNKKHLFIFLLAAYCIPAGWLLRNKAQSGFAGLTTQVGFDLLSYPAASVEAMRTGEPWEKVRADLRTRVDNQHPQGYATQADQSRAYQEAASEILKEHPLLFIQYSLLGVVRILAGTGVSLWFSYIPLSFEANDTWGPSVIGQQTSALMRRYPWLIPVQAVYLLALGILYGLAVWGWACLRRLGYRKEAFLMAVGTLYLLAAASHQGYSRFRIPMMPFLAVGIAAVFSRNGLRDAPRT